MSARDPQRTRRSILDSATVEFCTHGPAGARIDAIATAAGVNKRMLYHYFDSKEGLLAAVLKDRLGGTAGAGSPQSVTEALMVRQRRAAESSDEIRLLMWEALADDGRDIVARAQHTDALRLDAVESVDWLNEADRAHLELLLVSIAIFPHAFPQLTRLITGRPVDDPSFAAAWSGFLAKLAARLESRTPAMPEVAKPRFRLAATITEGSADR